MTTPAKEYCNTASVAVLSIPITATDVVATVTNYLGWPVPVDGVWGIIGRGTTSAEILLITNAAGNVLSIQRGQDGTVAMPHSAGDLIEHIAPAVHFVNAEEHQAGITGVHGINSPMAGVDDPATLTNKLYRGAFVSVRSDAEPPSITARYESVADQPGADGYVHRNTGGDVNGRAYLSEQAGAPRFQVYNDGRVKLSPAGTPGLENAGTSKLDGNITAGADLAVAGNATVTNTLTASDLTALDDVTVGDALNVTGKSTLAVTQTGALTAASAAVTGNATVTGTLGVTGTTTVGTVNAGAVNASSVTATGTVQGATVNGTTAVTGASVTATGAVSGATVAATGASTAHGGERLVASVANPTSVATPTTDQVLYDRTKRDLYRNDAGTWVSANTIGGRLAAGAGTIAAGIGATEVNLPGLAITGRRIRNGSWLVFNILISGQTNSAGSSFQLRVRMGTALTGTEVVGVSFIPTIAGFTHLGFFAQPYKVLADDTNASFHVSIQRVGGAGILDVNGGRRTAHWIDDRGGDSTVWIET